MRAWTRLSRLACLVRSCKGLFNHHSRSYMTLQPPLKLFGQTGLGHCPSRMSPRTKPVPLGQFTRGGWYEWQNAT